MKFQSLLSYFVFLLSCSVGFGQQFNFQNFNVEDGLAQSQVYAMYQAPSGELWMGTRGGGISVFDGFEFAHYTTNEGLNGNYVHDIVADAEGTVWVATNKGLSYFNGKRFVAANNSKLTSAVLDLTLSTDGKLYAAGPSGIFVVLKNQVKFHLSPDQLKGASANCVYAEKDLLIIGTDRALFRIRNGKVEDLSLQSPYMKNAITTVKRDRKGNFWIGTYGDGMYLWSKGTFSRIDYHLELYRQSVLDIYIDRTDNVWIATLSKGVLNYDTHTHTFLNISENEGLSNNHVRKILEDRNNSLWFGTSGGGVCHYLGKQFTTYDEQSGLGGNFIYSVFRSSKNQLWVGNSQHGVSTLENGTFTRYDANSGFQNVKVKAIDEDSEGTIWLGTDGQGVYAFRNNRFDNIDDLGAAYVKDIASDKRGTIWLATAGSGLVQITPRSGNYLIEKWTVAEGTISNRITALLFDRNGNLWYGSEGDGLAILSFQKGGPSSQRVHGIKREEIRCLTEDKLGRIWVGTAGNGLYVIDPAKPDRANQVSEDNGLVSGNIYLVTNDQLGNLLVGTEKGLDYIYLHEQGAIRQIRHYGKLDGFTGVETCQNAVWKDKDGTLWFGTINGLCRFNPAEMVSNDLPPMLNLRGVKLFYETIPASRLLFKSGEKKILQLAYYENHISFDFLGINLKRPDGVVYQWRLRGFDDRWSPSSKDHSILYSNLNPGHYVFEVKAANEDGIWNEEPLRFEFEIATPYWQKTWFRLLIGLGIAMLLLGTYLLSIRRIRRKAAARQQQLAFEKDFLELEQKAMRLQMNPHFIFNALNSIQSLIGTGKETEARYFLAKFSRLMRQILDNSRKSSISLEEEISTLENYLLIEQFCTAGRFEYELELSENMESDFINIPPMLLQPFVENAIKHGMKGRKTEETPGKIRVHFEENNNVLICNIEDNGIGREAAARLNEDSKETYHESTALQVTRERLERLSSQHTDLPALEIIDLYEAGKACGTRVILRIPID